MDKYPLDVERWIIEGDVKTEKETIYVDIPQGADNNEIIILKTTEMLAIIIKVTLRSLKCDTIFKRDGMDFIVNKIFH